MRYIRLTGETASTVSWFPHSGDCNPGILGSGIKKFLILGFQYKNLRFYARQLC